MYALVTASSTRLIRPGFSRKEKGMAGKKFIDTLIESAEYNGPMTDEDWTRELLAALENDVVTEEEISGALHGLRPMSVAYALWLLALCGVRAALPLAL